MSCPCLDPRRAEATVATLHDLHGDARGLLGSGMEVGAAIALVRPHMPQAWKVLRGPGEEDCGAITVADVGRADAGEQDGATGVDQEMAFDTADLLAAVVAMQPTALRGPDTLTVQMAALGVGSRPRSIRSRSRRAASIRSHTPSFRHCRQ